MNVMTSECAAVFRRFNRSIETCREDGRCMKRMKEAKIRVELRLFRPLLEAAMLKTTHMDFIPC